MELSQPSYLPPELAEKVLLETPTEDLSSLCRSSQLYYDICLSPIFWKKRFNLPFPLSSLVDTSNFTLEQWLKLDERVEKSLQETRELLGALKRNQKSIVNFTGDPKEREALKSPGIDYTLYKKFLSRAEKTLEEARYAIGKINYYGAEYENSRSYLDSEKSRVYRNLYNDLENFFPYLELYYEHGSFGYFMCGYNGAFPDKFPLSEEEMEELIFRLYFFEVTVEETY